MDMCYLACVYRTPSGYCGSTGGAATCPHRQKKQTNADRIRQMSDEELAEYLIRDVEAEAVRRSGRYLTAGEIDRAVNDCVSWLKSPVKVDE